VDGRVFTAWGCAGLAAPLAVAAGALVLLHRRTPPGELSA
jgi:hypothetical protein